MAGMIHAVVPPPMTPALRRLSALAPLDPVAVRALQAAFAQSQVVRARREVVADGAEIAGARLIVKGWGARVRLLADGRRQFLRFLLPGDIIGLCRQSAPVSPCAIVALTEMTLCAAPAPDQAPALDRAYAVSQALEEAYLLETITRLGRLNAQERIVSLFLELLERLALAGLVVGDTFELPLTQEILADSLGLTSVHLNRMLQQVRRTGDLDWRGGQVLLHDTAALARSIGRSPVRVSAAA